MDLLVLPVFALSLIVCAGIILFAMAFVVLTVTVLLLVCAPRLVYHFTALLSGEDSEACGWILEWEHGLVSQRLSGLTAALARRRVPARAPV